MNRYGQQYYQAQMAGASETPVIEVNGQLRFSLPGTPVFPSLTDDTILKPRLEWMLATDKAGKFPAEFSYVTGGMSWQADYNIVAPEKGDLVDIVGWVTMDNQTGKTFENARIKLMAGDVNKIQPGQRDRLELYAQMGAAQKAVFSPPVTEKAFDEYHLYTLERSTTLRDRETKQVEFIHAAAVGTKQLYIYDGVKIDANRYNGWGWDNIRNDHSYGTESNPKIWVMREFVNAQANHLGMPLPKGRVRFYRRNDDGQIEFTGENVIDHTPRDETVRIYTGNAFDLAGERRRTNYLVDMGKSTATESFEIKVRNHKKEAVRHPRGRTSVSRANLGYRVEFRRLQEDRRAHCRVSGNHRSERREDNHLYGALHLVRMPSAVVCGEPGVPARRTGETPVAPRGVALPPRRARLQLGDFRVRRRLLVASNALVKRLGDLLAVGCALQVALVRGTAHKRNLG